MATAPTSIRMPEEWHRIGNITAGFLVAVAFIVDAAHAGLSVIGMIPLIGWVILFTATPLVSVMAWIMFHLWYKLLGVDFFDGTARKAFVFFGSALLELFPIINALPLWTLGTVVLIGIVWAEDAIHNAAISEERQKLMFQLQRQSAEMLRRRTAFGRAWRQQRQAAEIVDFAARAGQQTSGETA